MAIIPRTKEGQRIQPSSPVPVGSSAAFGVEGEALGRLGGQIANYGNQLAQASERLNTEEGKNEVSNLYQQAFQEAERSSAADGSDIKSRFDDIVDAKLQNVRENYTGGRTSQEIESYAKVARDDMYTSIGAAEIKKREVYNIDKIEVIQNSSTQRIYANPNPALLQAEVASHTKLMEDLTSSGGLSAQNAAKLTKQFYNQTGESILKGMVLKQQYGRAMNLVTASQEVPGMVTSMSPDEAQKLGFITSQEGEALKGQGKSFELPVMTKGDKIKLTKEESLIMSNLDPNLRESLSQMLQAKMKEHTVMRLSDLNAKINGFQTIANSGGPIDEKQVAQIKAEINSNPNLTPDARIRLMDDVNVSKAINDQMQLVSVTPKNQAAALIDGLDAKISKYTKSAAEVDPRMARADTDFATLGTRAQAKAQFANQIQSMYAKRDADPVPFLRQDNNIELMRRASMDAGQNPEGTAMFERYNNALIAKANYLGTPVKIMEKSEAISFAKNLKAIPSSEDTNNYLTSLQQKYGKHFPRAVSEMIAADPEMAPFSAAIHAPPEQRAGLIDGIKNKKVIDKEFTSGLYKDQKPLVDMTVKNQLMPLRKIFVNGANTTSNLSMVQGLEEAVSIRAKQEIVNNNTDPTLAAEKAYGEIIGSQYHVVDRGRNSVLVPRALGGDKVVPNTRNIEKFLDTYSEPNNFKDLNIAVPATEKAAGVDEKGYFQKLAPRSKWVMNASQTGVRLMETDPRTGIDQIVYDNNGKAVERSYEDIHYKLPEKAKNQGLTNAERANYLKDSSAIRSKF